MGENVPQTLRGAEILYSALPAETEGKEKSFWRRFKDKWLRMEMLIWWTLLGVALGVAVGLALYHAGTSQLTIELIGYPGEVLIRALQELILPLIVCALMVGVFNLRHTPGGTGRIVRWSICYYMLSMLLAVAVGIMLVESIKPGKHMSFTTDNARACTITGSVPKADTSVVDSLLNVGRDFIPTNIVGAAASSNYLGVITFSVMFATVVSTMGEQAEPLIHLIEIINRVILKIEEVKWGLPFLRKVGVDFLNNKLLISAGNMSAMLHFAMIPVTRGEGVKQIAGFCCFCLIVESIRSINFWQKIHYVIAFTPIGVASLIASTILKACNLGGLLKALGLYMGTVLSGFFVHGVVVLPLTMILMSHQNPLTAAKGFLPALLMGLGTSSSAATMPVTMQNAVDMGCTSSVVQFVIPLGTNVNRDGAALYEAVSVIFILQAHGISMTTGNLIVVVITATLAAIGAASIPNSALVTMITILQALNYPEFISDVAILYAVDWFLGMVRTSLNIWGDACAVIIVDNWVSQYTKKHDVLAVIPNRTVPIQLRQNQIRSVEV